MSVAEKLALIAENESKVFEAGKENKHKSFWNRFIAHTTMGYAPYYFAGPGWKDDTFQPTKDLILTSSSTGIFRQSSIKNLKKCLEDCGVSLDTSRATSLENAFSYGSIEYLPKISCISAGKNLAYMCGENSDGAGHLISIDELEIAETNTFKSSFNYCKKLEHVIFTGTLATNGLDLHWSPLDRESLVSIIRCLSTTATTTGLTITLSQTAVENAFTAEEWAAIAGTEDTVGPGIEVDGELIVRPANWSIALL